LTRTVLVESGRLPPPFSGDPADQIIVATARHLGATLVTRADERDDLKRAETSAWHE